jgi:dephospho-CoA kinase
MRIVVTGGIGSGKSTVSKELIKHMPGYELVSADQIVHELYEQNARFKADLIKRFGTAERKEIAVIVFANPARRVELEVLSWAYLAQVVDAVFDMPNVVFEFPLFFEHPHWLGLQDAVVLVHCTESVQRERVLARDGISAENFERIRRAQLPVDEKLKRADFAIDTTDTRSFEHNISNLAAQLKARAELTQA